MPARRVMLALLAFAASQGGRAFAQLMPSRDPGAAGVVMTQVGVMPVMPEPVSSPQLVESMNSIALTAKATIETPKGAQSVQLRLGTKDIVEGMKASRGLVGSGGALVVRREISDVEFENLDSFLLFGSTLYPAEEDSCPLPPAPDLPESFYGYAESFSARASDGERLTLVQEGVRLYSIGTLACDDEETSLVGIERRSARLATHHGVEIGYLFGSVSANVLGGSRVPALGDRVLLVTGTLRRGPEKLVGP